jgi:hypothetical protein
VGCDYTSATRSKRNGTVTSRSAVLVPRMPLPLFPRNLSLCHANGMTVSRSTHKSQVGADLVEQLGRRVQFTARSVRTGGTATVPREERDCIDFFQVGERSHIIGR